MNAMEKIQNIIEVGYQIMPDETDRQLTSLVNGNTINCPALANLINEITIKSYVMIEKAEIPQSDKADALKAARGIDGEQLIQQASPSVLGNYILGLVKTDDVR